MRPDYNLKVMSCAPPQREIMQMPIAVNIRAVTINKVAFYL